jgi:hypothetical protein
MRRLHVRDPAADLLVGLLVDPDASRGLALEDWDRVVRVGRASRLLAALRRRLEDAGALAAVPAPVRGHLDSEAAAARYRKQMVLRELHELAGALDSAAAPLVLVKGAAYVVQRLRVADARVVSDVDLLVPQPRLDAIETRLVEAGWQPVDVDPYDDRYYREWSHEVPPMRYPGHALELDLHHAILPPISRVRADPTLLFAGSRPVAGTTFRVLAPEDQIAHACVHTFVDSDLADRLRDVVDLDGLLREFAEQPGFWDRLCARAAELGLGRGVWYGLRYAERLVGTPVPESVRARMAAHAPGASVRALMDWLVASAAPPLPLERSAPPAVRIARWLATMRYFWLRMPLPILLRHAAVKGYRRLFPRIASTS